jgi:hypothetical protein
LMAVGAFDCGTALRAVISRRGVSCTLKRPHYSLDPTNKRWISAGSSTERVPLARISDRLGPFPTACATRREARASDASE